MKHFITSKIAVAALLTLSVPATLLAQDKTEKENSAEQIIITRKGNVNDKTVIEINGDKITVNGKVVDKKNDGDVIVQRNKLRDVRALAGTRVYNGGQSFSFDNEHLSLFSEDENRAMLGVSTKDSDNDKVKGAQVTTVSKGSAADKAGLKAGDVITRIGDKKIETAEDVSKAVREHKPGNKVPVTIMRDGKEQKYTAELDKWKGVNITAMSLPRVADVWAPAVPDAPMAGMGGTYYYNTGQPRLGISIQDTEDGKGVKVLNVTEESNAAKAGLKKDDVITHVNDKAVNSADEVSKQVREAKDKASFTMKVERNGKTQTLEVRTPRRLKTTSL